MKKNIHTSDLELLLSLVVPEKHELHIFDPFKKLIVDRSIHVYKDDVLPKVLVNMASKVICSELWMEEFDYIIDFGTGNKVSSGFRAKSFRYINQDDQRMRWIYPRDLSIPTFLNFHHPVTRKEKLYYRWLRAVFALKISSFASSGSFSVYYQKPLKFEEAIRHLCFNNYSIAGDSYNQAKQILIELNSHGRTTNFVRMALAEMSSVNRIDELMTVMDARAQSSAAYFADIEETEDKSFPPASGIRYQPEAIRDHITSHHIEMLHWLYEGSACLERLDGTDFYGKMEHDLNLLSKHEHFGQLERVWIKLDKLSQKLKPDTLLPVADSHGDFTPWIMYVADSNMYTYEWELLNRRVPVLFNLFHFIFQSGVLMKQYDYKRIKADLCSSLEDPAVQRIIRQYHLDVNFHYQLYLVMSISHYMNLADEYDFFNTQTILLLDAWEDALEDALENEISEQNSSFTEEPAKKVFIRDFIHILSAYPHAWMKYFDGMLEQIEEQLELDILVQREDLSAIIDQVKAHAMIDHLRVHMTSDRCNLEISFKDHTFLCIDLLSSIRYKWYTLMDPKEVLASVSTASPVSLPDTKYNFEYTFLSYTLNAIPIPAKYRSYFLGFAPDLKPRMKMYLLQKYIISYCSLEELLEFSPQMRRGVLRGVAKFKLNQGYSQLKHMFSFYLDRLRSMGKKKGVMVAFRSMSSNRGWDMVNQLSERMGKKLVVLTDASFEGEGEASRKEGLSGRKKNEHPFIATLRFLYAFVIHSLDQVNIYFRYIQQGRVVIYRQSCFSLRDYTGQRNILLPDNWINSLQNLTRPRYLVCLEEWDTKVAMEMIIKKKFDRSSAELPSAAVGAG